jgi:hypothetical protein
MQTVFFRCILPVMLVASLLVFSSTGSAENIDPADSNSGGASIGAMPIRTLSPDNDTVNAGDYTATNSATVDGDPATGNIRSGVAVFGVASDPNVVNTSSGDAVSADIVSGKKTGVAVTEVTGTATFKYVPKTGQTTSYAAGDDGDLEKGVAWPSPRFTDNADGTVTDNLTGLIWLKNANADGVKTWADAIAYCNGLASGSAGLTDGSSVGDWRLPNRFELESLIDLSQCGPCLPPGHPFINVKSANYWSSSTVAAGTDYAWYVLMSNGYVFNLFKTSSYYVWPVRAGN